MNILERIFFSRLSPRFADVIYGQHLLLQPEHTPHRYCAAAWADGVTTCITVVARATGVSSSLSEQPTPLPRRSSKLFQTGAK
ncbi:hypothetical protein BaRGS_00002235 [Batillaria attramentaria]|uniref:Uncharacterized protein n=1 Tax=Batillaria attramentaria TaxID=370345 RepID=A0ABD0M5F6_9CAEN